LGVFKVASNVALPTGRVRVTVNTALFDRPWSEAVTVVDPVALCVSVVTVNVPVRDPAGIRIVAGTVAMLVLLLVSATLAPSVGAGPVRVTVPVDACPPETLLGLKLTDAGVGDATTVRFADCVTPAG
jgi:hypothetical protein